MKAPEKIYIDQHPFRDEYQEYWYSSPVGDKSVEYVRKDIVNSMLEMATHPTKHEIRKDILIEKACDWIEDHIYEYLKMNRTWNEPDYDLKLMEDFRNHMKGE